MHFSQFNTNFIFLLYFYYIYKPLILPQNQGWTIYYCYCEHKALSHDRTNNIEINYIYNKKHFLLCTDINVAFRY